VTKDDQIVGGYNPKGLCGYGEYRGSVAALFSRSTAPPALSRTTLCKVGCAGLAQVDNPETAVSFGADIPLNGFKTAASKLGSYYERMQDERNSLFRSGRGQIQLKSLRVYSGVYEKGEYVPYSDAEPFALSLLLLHKSYVQMFCNRPFNATRSKYMFAPSPKFWVRVGRSHYLIPLAFCTSITPLHTPQHCPFAAPFMTPLPFLPPLSSPVSVAITSFLQSP